MDLKKVQAIWDWTAPSMVTKLRSFLGLENYYHRFIEGYIKKAILLFDFLKKKINVGTGLANANLHLTS